MSLNDSVRALRSGSSVGSSRVSSRPSAMARAALAAPASGRTTRSLDTMPSINPTSTVMMVAKINEARTLLRVSLMRSLLRPSSPSRSRRFERVSVNVRKNSTPDNNNEPTTNVARIRDRTPMRRGRRRRTKARSESRGDGRDG